MHKSVLLDEALDYLECEDKKILLDCTIGGAGHTKEIIKRLPPGGRLIGIDADRDAIEIATENLRGLEDKFTLVHENFRNLDKVLGRLNIDKVDGMLFDLGISSFQLQDEERGFSFLKGQDLDMRMDRSSGKPLSQIINKMYEDELGSIIRDYGQERFWRRVAKQIVSERKREPIEDPQRLAQIVRSVVRPSGKSKIDPATRTFQALRIFVNDELNALKEAMDKIDRFLRKGGRVAVISFHSLEDRIVKLRFKELARQDQMLILTKKPLRPQLSETEENPRSRSACLRVAEKI
ncbi:16S rRNA (cytosine(1402)-N(4))-methyltransferase RsmH [Candidatus Omnitrophota bacterium]